jgi:ribonuclease Z
MKMTLTRTADRYVVHELLSGDDETTPCVPPEVLHFNEVAGRDIRCASEDGLWRELTSDSSLSGEVAVDACPISHRGESCHRFPLFCSSCVL